MKAELQPLEDKYYGTEIRIDDADDNEFSEGLIQIWVMGNYKPSRRGLENLRRNWIEETGMEPTDEEWHDEKASYFCDSHYETETSLHIAELLVKAINEEEEGKV
jgi:hypothetical protein